MGEIAEIDRIPLTSIKKMKKIRLLVIVILIIVIIVLITTTKKSDTGNFNYLTVGKSRLSVEIVQTPAEIERGLSGRKELCQRCGLLFIFPEKQKYSFWMKQMYFDIDILWIDGDKVVDITFGAKRPTETEFNSPREVYQPKVPVDRVLEVNAGWVTDHRVGVGDTVSLN